MLLSGAPSRELVNSRRSPRICSGRRLRARLVDLFTADLWLGRHRDAGDMADDVLHQ